MDSLRRSAPSPRPHLALARVPSPPRREPFGPRIIRALLLLLVAIAPHVWLIQAPVPGVGPAPATPPPPAPALHVGAEGFEAPVTLVHQDVVVSRTVREQSPPDGDRSKRRELPDSLPAIRRAVFVTEDADPAVRRADAVTLDSSEASESRQEPAPLPALDVSRRLPDVISINPIAAPEPPARATEMANAAPNTNAVAADTDARLMLRKQQEAIVLTVLREYTHAYARLDVEAAKAYWPSLDGRRLQRAFSQLDAQELRLDECRVKVTDRDANARCRVDAVYRPKIGSRVVRRNGAWNFDLARRDDGWRIVDARMQ